MSEYQFYEFRAVDKPLTAAQMKELRSYSSRAEITSSGFKNEYNYGSFRGKPVDWMEQYFDAHVYASCWGHFTLMLRFPSAVLPEHVIAEYGNDESLTWRRNNDHIVISWFRQEEESYEAVYEDEGWMGNLLSIRDELVRGDYRSLYIGWLAGIYETEPVDSDDAEDDDFLEPPVPSGLNSLTEAQQALTDFLQVDVDLIAAAAQNSEALAAGPTKHDAERWCASLTDQDIRTTVAQMLLDEGVGTQRDLQHRFRRWFAEAEPKPEHEPVTRRTANELFALAELEKKKRKARDLEAKRIAHEQRMKALVPRIPQKWQTAYELSKKTTASAYNEIRDLLVEVRDASEYAGRSDEFAVELERFLSTNTSKALKSRLDEAGVVTTSGKLKLI